MWRSVFAVSAIQRLCSEQQLVLCSSISVSRLGHVSRALNSSFKRKHEFSFWASSRPMDIMELTILTNYSFSRSSSLFNFQQCNLTNQTR